MTMTTVAAAVTAVTVAVPVGTVIRMWVTGERTRAEIRAAFRQHNNHDDKGAASSAKTPAAPCDPAPSEGNEVTPS
ncbi:hypothetical protein [Nonomuraea longicatena]|uniref:Secreted protein n=1 Tax=Nonomuraea longicatena TaxID=83682 RepID=A0ABP4BJ97_9ACTN